MIIKQRPCQVCGKEFMPRFGDSPDRNICYSCEVMQKEEGDKESKLGCIIAVVIVIVVIGIVILLKSGILD